MAFDYPMPLNQGNWWFCVNADHREGKIRPGHYMGGECRAMPVLEDILRDLGITDQDYEIHYSGSHPGRNYAYAPNHHYVDICFANPAHAVLFKLSVPSEITHW